MMKKSDWHSPGKRAEKMQSFDRVKTFDGKIEINPFNKLSAISGSLN